MELYEEIVLHALSSDSCTITFEGKVCTIPEIIEGQCYQALKKIQAILCDDTLNDSECFLKIEEIICVLENLGSGAGVRHDFG